MKRLLDYDKDSGLRIWHDYDTETGLRTLRYDQDATAILERNKAVQNVEQGGARGMNAVFREGVKNDWVWVASIPIGVQYKWLYEHGVNIHNKNHWPKVRNLLNDPEYQYLRTGTGRI